MAYPDFGTNRDWVEMALVKIWVRSRQAGFQPRLIETISTFPDFPIFPDFLSIGIIGIVGIFENSSRD